MSDDKPATRSEMALWGRAIKQRWPISDEVRERMVATVLEILSNPESQREALAAAKVLVSADAQNLKTELHVDQRERDDRIAAIRAEIEERLRIAGDAGRPGNPAIEHGE